MGGVKEFVKKVNTNDVLQAEMKALAESGADFEQVMALAKKNGFEFTKEEWGSFVKAVAKNNQGKLDDEQIAAVAGGSPWQDWIICSIVLFYSCGGKAVESLITNDRDCLIEF